MRSRNGDSTLSRSIYKISLYTISLIFISLSLSAKEYLISYRYVVKDAVLYNESLMISEAMTKCEGEPQSSFTIENQNSKNIKDLIHKNFYEFTEYIQKLGMSVENMSNTTNMKNTTTTILTLKTTCFKVDFNENFAKMAPLK